MRIIVCAFLALVSAFPSFGQQPLSRQLTLAEMTQRARTIVHGQIIEARVEPLPSFRNVSTLKLTVRVIDSIYGNSGKQISFRLFFPPGFRQTKAPSSEYRIGQELVLFMHQESQYGLTSPVGGNQGRFQVQRTEREIRVSNALNNSGLFSDLSSLAKAQGRPLSTAESFLSDHKAGAVALDDFVALVRQLAANKVSQ